MMVDEKDILTGLKAGSEKSFRLFFDAYYEVLMLYAFHLLKDIEASEDVVQECFVDLWKNRRFENITEGLDKYMFQAVKHAGLNYIRTRRRRERRHLIAVETQDESRKEDEVEERITLLYEAINDLPAERKKIFIMVCVEGKKYKEVADVLNISINTVKTQMGRSFQYLRERLRHVDFCLLIFFFRENQDRRNK